MANMKILALCIGALAHLGLAQAQDAYPSRAITLVVPGAAGSSTDAAARLLGGRLSEKLKQPVVIDNRPGANGQIAMEWIVKQKADGYTLGLAASTTHAANPSLYRALKYHPVTDFTAIAGFSKTSLIVAVTKSKPIRNLPEFLAYAKQNPGKLSYASANAPAQVAAETIAAAGGFSLVRIPYKSSGQAIADVIAGHVDMYFADMQSGMSAAKSGQVTGLAVTSAQRSPQFPSLPAVAEVLPGVEIIGWNALVGPANMPPEIVSRIAAAVKDTLAEKATQQSMLAVGLEPMLTQKPQDLQNFIVSQMALWNTLARQAGIDPE